MKAIARKTISENQVFKGSKGNPFLAPRGVWRTSDHLIVSDTGQNRVFIWKGIPGKEFTDPDVVLGQDAKELTKRNGGELVSASSLQYPSGVWSDGKRLIVADAWNHRVLIWNTIPDQNGVAADVVLGQPDFTSNAPNTGEVGGNPTANSLYWPYGVHSDGKQLWVADTGNRRVLYYKTVPNTNFTPADAVIGQDDFISREYDEKHAIWPYSVRINGAGQMAITDTQYFRVLLWKNWRSALDNPADYIFGQKNFQDNGQNQFRLQPAANTLNWCYDSFFYNNSLWVADTGNSRLLKFNRNPSSNNTNAKDLFGHDDFETGSENQNTIMGTEDSLYWPFSLCIHDNEMAIADTGNHRIIFSSLKY